MNAFRKDRKMTPEKLKTAISISDDIKSLEREIDLWESSITHPRQLHCDPQWSGKITPIRSKLSQSFFDIMKAGILENLRSQLTEKKAKFESL